MARGPLGRVPPPTPLVGIGMMRAVYGRTDILHEIMRTIGMRVGHTTEGESTPCKRSTAEASRSGRAKYPKWVTPNQKSVSCSADAMGAIYTRRRFQYQGIYRGLTSPTKQKPLRQQYGAQIPYTKFIKSFNRSNYYGKKYHP